MFKKTSSGRVNKMQKELKTKMNEKYHLKPTIKEIEERTISLTRKPLTKIIMSFVIFITTMESTSKRLIHHHTSILRGLKPMMIGIQEKTNSEKKNKLLNSSTTKKNGNSIVILRVHNITLEAMITKTTETQRDLSPRI